MRILLVGEIHGSPDEGMRKVSQSLFARLSNTAQVAVKALSPVRAVSCCVGLARWSPDVVHYIHGPSWRSVVILWWLRRVCSNCRSVLSFTHPAIGGTGRRLLRALPPDYALAESSRWQRELSRMGIPAALMSLSAVDLSRFRPVSLEQRFDLKRKLAFPADQRIVLHVGHVKPNRNLDALVPVQKLSGVQVVVLGSTTTHLDSALSARLSDEGVIVRVGYVRNVEEYYQAADCYVFPIVDPEGAIEVPLSVLEAMATNLPVVATDFGGLPDFFGSQNGLLLIKDTAFCEWHQAVRTALDLTNATTRELVSDWAWGRVAAKLLHTYSELLSS